MFDIKLYEKYGEYNVDGYYIEDHSKWHYYAQRPDLYRKTKIEAWCWLIIPVCGMIGANIWFEKMGLSWI